MRGPDRDHEIATALRAARLAAECSQVKAADEMRALGWHWNQSTVSDLERGARSLRLAEAVDLSGILRTTLSDLAGGGEHPAVEHETAVHPVAAARRAIQEKRHQSYSYEVAWQALGDLAQLWERRSGLMLPETALDPGSRDVAAEMGVASPEEAIALHLGLAFGSLEWTQAVEILASFGLLDSVIDGVRSHHQMASAHLATHRYFNLDALRDAPTEGFNAIQSLGRELRAVLNAALPNLDELWSQQ